MRSAEGPSGLTTDKSPPERSRIVASLLTVSDGFLDAFTWLYLGGVFANSQTGNVVFVGTYAAIGEWQKALHHVPPILAFVFGAVLAMRIRRPLFCLSVEIAALLAFMLIAPSASGGYFEIVPISLVVGLQAASFRKVEQWAYMSVTVTGDMLRGIDQLTSPNSSDGMRGAGAMLLICTMFLLGAVAGGFATPRFAKIALVIPTITYACPWRLSVRQWPRLCSGVMLGDPFAVGVHSHNGVTDSKSTAGRMGLQSADR